VTELAIATIGMYGGCVCVELELGDLDCFESWIGNVVAQWRENWVGEIDVGGVDHGVAYLVLLLSSKLAKIRSGKR
jgi:hypothetical protein